MPSVSVNGALAAKAHERITATTASVGLTAANYDVAVTTNDPYSKIRRAEEALITVETEAIRWTINGTTPTTTASTAIGHLALAGDAILVCGYQQIKNFRAINAVASNGASIQVTFLFKE